MLLHAPWLMSAEGWESLGNVSGVKTLPQGVEITAQRGKVRISALSPNVIRVRYAPRGQFPPEYSFAVLPGAFPQAPTVRVQETADAVIVKTTTIQAEILRSPLRIMFLDANGATISQDLPGSPVSFNGEAFRVWKSMPQDEHYFGLGDKPGPLDHRNIAFTMWNTDAFGWQESTDPLYKTIPFFLSMRGGSAYGIFLDNTYRSNFDFGKESRASYSFGADGA